MKTLVSDRQFTIKPEGLAQLHFDIFTILEFVGCLEQRCFFGG